LWLRECAFRLVLGSGGLKRETHVQEKQTRKTREAPSVSNKLLPKFHSGPTFSWILVHWGPICGNNTARLVQVKIVASRVRVSTLEMHSLVNCYSHTGAMRMYAR